MKLAVILMIFMILLVGCSTVKNSPVVPITNNISETSQLILNEKDLLKLEMISNGTDCKTETYETNEHSPLAQYSICNYIISNLNNTEVIIEFKKYTNLNDLNGSYDYESSHLFSANGIISENTYGDRSKFHVNTDDDYGAEFNTQGIYFYHLWICKDTYLIHITSKGSENAQEVIAKIGTEIMSKFN
ncbi:MAG: hypothetical protein ACP5N1_04990 [Candidatus Woesearchaeota archaeon]